MFGPVWLSVSADERKKRASSENATTRAKKKGGGEKGRGSTTPSPSFPSPHAVFTVFLSIRFSHDLEAWKKLM